MEKGDRFRVFSSAVAEKAGTAWAFIIAFLVIVIWVVTGPLFGFSDTWQLVINTGTTIITFLMVFLIQNTQNRDSKALHLKLDELIRSSKEARNDLLSLENMAGRRVRETKGRVRKCLQRKEDRDFSGRRRRC